MKKLFLALGLSMVALAAFALHDARPRQRASASQDGVSRFIDHPSHCDQLQGRGLDGDVPHPDMHTALEAALDAASLPADQVVGQINVRCNERLGALVRISNTPGA